jgi:hypothetical protein
MTPKTSMPMKPISHMLFSPLQADLPKISFLPQTISISNSKLTYCFNWSIPNYRNISSFCLIKKYLLLSILKFYLHKKNA